LSFASEQFGDHDGHKREVACLQADQEAEIH